MVNNNCMVWSAIPITFLHTAGLTQFTLFGTNRHLFQLALERTYCKFQMVDKDNSATNWIKYLLKPLLANKNNMSKCLLTGKLVTFKSIQLTGVWVRKD